MEKLKPAKVLKGQAKPADQKQASFENNQEILKKIQLPQKFNEIKEEAKNTKEVKVKENIRGGIRHEF